MGGCSCVPLVWESLKCENRQPHSCRLTLSGHCPWALWWGQSVPPSRAHRTVLPDLLMQEDRAAHLGKPEPEVEWQVALGVVARGWVWAGRASEVGLAKNNTKGGQGSGLLEPLGALGSTIPRGGPQRPCVGLVWTCGLPGLLR